VHQGNGLQATHTKEMADVKGAGSRPMSAGGDAAFRCLPRQRGATVFL